MNSHLKWSIPEKNGYGYTCSIFRLDSQYLIENIAGELVLRGPYDSAIIKECSSLIRGKRWIKSHLAEIQSFISDIEDKQLYELSIQ